MKNRLNIPLCLAFFLFVGCFKILPAQDRAELMQQLVDPIADTTRVNIYCELAVSYLPYNIDSAEYWLEKVEQTHDPAAWSTCYVESLLKLMGSYRNLRSFSRADSCANHIIDNFAKHENVVANSEGLRTIAYSYASRQNLIESLAAHQELKDYLDANLPKDHAEYANCYGKYYMGVGIAYALADDPSSSLAYFLKSDSILKEGGSEYLVSFSKYLVGNVYTDLDLPERSNSFFKQLEKGAEEGWVTMGMEDIYSTMGVNYMKLEKLDSARMYLAKNLALVRANGDSIAVGTNFAIQAEIYEDEKAFELAVAKFNRAIEIFKLEKDTIWYQDTRFAKVVCCLEGGIFLDECGPIIEEVLSYYNRVGVVERQAQSYKCRSDLRLIQGNSRGALEDYKMFDSLNTVFQERIHGELTVAMETKHETDLYKQDAARQAELTKLSEADSQNKSNLLKIVGGGALVLLVILIALLLLYRKLKKSQQLVSEQKANIEKREQEKSTLLKELHHRVKNNLQIVSSLLNLQGEAVKDHAAQDAFKNGQNRVDAMAMIHRYLYATDELTTLEINSYITQLVKSIAHSYGYGKNDIELSFDVTDEPIDVDLAIPLGLIANELVSNAFKHAYKDVVEPKLHIALTKAEDLLLLVKDNGAGFEEKAAGTEEMSFGMELVQSLSKQLKATLDYQFEEGTVVRMTIPKATLTKANA